MKSISSKQPAGWTWTRETQPRAIRAFTLIELIIVIAIIGILAALIFPTIRAINRKALVRRARTEMEQVETYIAAYKAKLGHYPPDNRNPADNQLVPGLNQLYYELMGTTLINDTYVSKDGTGPPFERKLVPSYYGPGVIGFVNCQRGNVEDGTLAVQFLKPVRDSLVATPTITNPETRVTITARILVCSVPGIDPNVPPISSPGAIFNPWRYNSSAATNNTASYDLWTDILANGKAVRICNWSKQPIDL